jgi:hypothetical protein
MPLVLLLEGGPHMEDDEDAAGMDGRATHRKSGVCGCRWKRTRQRDMSFSCDRPTNKVVAAVEHAATTRRGHALAWHMSIGVTENQHAVRMQRLGAGEQRGCHASRSFDRYHAASLLTVHSQGWHDLYRCRRLGREPHPRARIGHIVFLLKC